MNAQEVINNCQEQTDWLSVFYPTLWNQQKADENLSKCLKQLN